ncbi:cell division protein FtsA [Balneicella halophila]|uniref:Cell division protein FtsA n=1 Tax=Balneicella halophila TaxID=1537566 RepID=A0A7L4UPH7_BALHA|nr:cell division protein FtsA [Balneicella halophila]PVX50944.1 cell division protein FtsA [Balneicella halophila]
MQRDRVICIDIGSHSIKAVVGTKSFEGHEIIDATLVPAQGVAYGVVNNVEKFTASIKTALKNVKAKENDLIIVGVSNYYVESFRTPQQKFIAEGKKIDHNDLDELYENAENAYLKVELVMLDVFLQHYNVDEIKGIQNPLDMEGIKLEGIYNIFSCSKKLISNIEQCVNNAGFDVAEFIFSPYYASKVIFTEEDKETGVLVIDLGADVTRISLFVDGAMYASFAVPFGSQSVTQDIKSSYPVTMKQADALKKDFSHALADLAEENAEVSFSSADAWGGRSLRVSQLSAVVQCRLDEIFRGISYQLRKMGLDDFVESITLVGGGALQNSMKEFLEKKFEVPVREAKLREDVFVDNKNLSALYYANALGMLHYMIDEEIEKEANNQSGFFEKISTGLRSLFGSRGSGDDAKM